MKRTFKYYDGSPVILKTDLIVAANEIIEVEEDDAILSFLENSPRFEELINKIKSTNKKTLSTTRNKNYDTKKVKINLEEK